MARQLTIVGLGEAVLVEHPDRTEAAGLAAHVARQAVRCGHVGVAITRIGQDPQADALLQLLKSAGVDATHVQTDPDLPTGRVIVRPVGGRVARYLESRAAFDNLQPDFDLEDAAQQADAVVFGMLTRRGGQTRSEENRFLGACAAGFKLFDLTNRADDSVERGHALSGLELADAAVVDDPAMKALRPASGEEPTREVVLDLLRDRGLAFVMMIGKGGETTARVTLHTADEVHEGEVPADRVAIVTTFIFVLATHLRGRPLSAALERAAQAAAHAVAHPDEPIPQEWLE